MIDNENNLLKAVSEGDEDAYAEIYRYYYPKVKCFFMKLINDEDDVKDLAQNVFVKIWLMRSAVAEIRSFGAYLYRMCKNTAIDYCRHRNINIPLSEEYDDNVTTADENFFAKEIEAQIASVIDKMPKKRKKVYIMSRVEGLSNDEIASQLNISKRTVENQLSNVLKELRKITSCISIFL